MVQAELTLPPPAEYGGPLEGEGILPRKKVTNFLNFSIYPGAQSPFRGRALRGGYTRSNVESWDEISKTFRGCCKTSTISGDFFVRLKDRPRNECGKEKHSKGDQQKYILHSKISLPRVFPLGFIQKISKCSSNED